MPFSLCFRSLVVLASLFLARPAPLAAAASREWITLTKCEYVTNENNDGDSFIVRSGTKEFSLRLYYVDAPEAKLTYAERTREQSVHFGVTLDATLKAGAEARERTRTLLSKPFTVVTRWAIAPGRGQLPRHYAFVEVEGRSLAEILVSEGLAMTKGVAPNLPSGERASAYRLRLQKMEAEARANRAGAWSTAAPAPQ